MAIKFSPGPPLESFLIEAVPIAGLALATLGAVALAKKIQPIASVKLLEAADYLLKFFEPEKKAAPSAPSMPSVRGYKTIRVFDSGNSRTYLLEYLKDGKNYVCKELPAPKSLAEKRVVLRETLILQQLNHPNIIKFRGLSTGPTGTKMLLEYVPNSVELYEFMEAKGALPTDLSMKILGQLVTALKYCHDQNIIHRDIKAENIIIDPQSQAIKLIDFGMARYIPANGAPISHPCGTMTYNSPELIQGLYDGRSNDIWGVGVLLYEMAVGNLPFQHENRADVKRLIVEGKYTIPDHVDDQMKDLIKGILNVDTHRRFSLDNIIQHPLSQKYRQFFAVPKVSQSKSHPVEVDLRQPQIDVQIPFSTDLLYDS